MEIRYLFILLLLVGCTAQESDIKLPPGIKIETYADVPGARSMDFSDGVLYVGTRDEGKVYKVDGNVTVLAEGLNSPNGVAYMNGSLYVAEISRILKMDVKDGSYQVITSIYPKDASHGWKYIAFGPDGKLYVPVGMPCNVCKPKKEIYGTITRIDPDGKNFEIYARGIRNSVGFDWKEGELYFTDNGRDWMGNDKPPDELNHAPRSGLHFGFPYCHSNISEPEYGRDCSYFESPAVELGPHVAALGMEFYEGDMFPQYEGDIFIAEHGSWNRDPPIGYRVTRVDLEDGSYEVFAEGWLGNGSSWGRPVDIEVIDDGSILISDDKAGKIYRIYS